MTSWVFCPGGTRGAAGAAQPGELPSQGAAEALASPPRRAAELAVPMSCLSPACSSQGWPWWARGHQGVPVEEVLECKGVPGWGKEMGLNLRKCSPATRRLSGEWVGAPSPALFGARPRCRAQGRGHPQMAPVSGTKSGARFHGEAPTTRVMVPPGTGTVSGLATRNPGCTPQLGLACGQHRAPARRRAGEVGQRRALAAKTLRRDHREPRNPSAGGRCPSPPGSKQAPFASSRNA